MKKGVSLLKTRIATAQQTAKALEPIYAKIQVPRNAHHSSLRQKIAGRWYSTSANNMLRFAYDTAAPRVVRDAPVRSAIAGQLKTSSPFGSTLRPMLTGGVMPRTTSGYSLGGVGARYFSHSPAAPAQVMSQVSAAMRAFLYSGKGQMDSHRWRHGGKLGVRAQLAASMALENAPGAYVDFDLSPTITCISPLGRSSRCSIENEEFLEDLSTDLGAMVGALVAINADIRRLSALGDLPVSLAGLNGHILRVHFRGCEKDFVERLCDEVGIKSGVVHEDERFAFAFLAPSLAGAGAADWRDMMAANSPPLSSTYSEDGFLDAGLPSSTPPSRISGSDSLGEDYYFEPAQRPVMVNSPSPGYHSGTNSSADYSGLEGIHRFLAECEEYRNFQG